ncbi:hypothetical protein [Burkholderia multivorans]|uniref:hypothetical protein n=1 Tax=Burkholderia multivorans TaxID=87883 RepID=UPI0021BFCCE7|nr:hypothetical protein [Burkholderia multivorans]MDR9052084.1 hypothetical protein [Burkholderia multivorans]MDR9060156.1 hypothetical protein [Burkholderia multivorans]MDR9062461.1 hypothetical protein [Burkholderia multivorans]MDR9072191.1 hypothetical protein [Burkholderia multivorans]MDR9076516.1 hypothetical protein [Burkholderia multivorans]
MSNYDPLTCITAYELREAGIPIDEKIPDCAWVPRASVDWKVGEITVSADGSASYEFRISFGEPFRWISMNVTVSGAPQ